MTRGDAEHATGVPPIFIVSGGVGASGEHVVRTALAQFEEIDVPVLIVPHVRRVDQIKRVVSEAAARHGMIVHTLVDATLRRSLQQLAEAQQVPTLDLMGPLFEWLSATLRQPPLNQPGRYRRLHATLIARIEAIEWTLDHDDGRKPHEWDQAEIVLAGVSRVGKTPTSVYLAVLGWKVANIPLVRDIPPPPELFMLDRQHVIGLTIDPGQLVHHRRGRQQRLGIPMGHAYTDPSDLYDEVDAARQVFRRGGFRVIDVTDKPIEQIADEIIRLVSPK